MNQGPGLVFCAVKTLSEAKSYWKASSEVRILPTPSSICFIVYFVLMFVDLLGSTRDEHTVFHPQTFLLFFISFYSLKEGVA